MEKVEQVLDIEVSAYMAEKITSMVDDMGRKKVLRFALNSTGGSSRHGFAIYDYLKSLDIDIEITAIGECSSAAVLVLMAASKRIVGRHTELTIHPPKFVDHKGKTTRSSRSKILRMLGVESAISLYKSVQRYDATLKENGVNLSSKKVVTLDGYGALKAGIATELLPN